MRIRIKVCCISSLDEARTAIKLGADAVGLVGHMPSGPGVIGDKLIKQIAENVSPPISSFLLTSETSVDKIIAHHKITNTTTIQLVELTSGTHADLKQALPSVKIVQVVHVLDENSVERALELSDKVDALLLDSGNPNKKVKELGGTGKTHNWELSAKIVKQSAVPVFLAGGLNPENIQQAIETVQPFGVDVCSGVRTNNKLDEQKLSNFINNIKCIDS